MSTPLSLFEGVGVEIEFAIVDRETLDVKPIADHVLGADGEPRPGTCLGEIGWSNELALHVLEFKTKGPAERLHGLADAFQASVREANQLLRDHGAQLLPTGMHPWMCPEREFRIWPFEYGPVYRAFDRLFDCRGHGWANLQSTHLNLSFANDAELAQLHAAVRLLLPALPALAASTPFCEGTAPGALDVRLTYYGENSKRIPSVAGEVVPEPVASRHEYESKLLGRIYRDLAPHDPEGVLQQEWVNARGAIARFDRMALEIRVLDAQECPAADLAIASLVVAVLRRLCADSRGLRDSPSQASLVALYRRAVQQGGATPIDDTSYLKALGVDVRPTTLSELWRQLATEALPLTPPPPECEPSLQVLLDEGCLASRILARLRGDHRHGRLVEIYAELAARLAEGRSFTVKG